MGKSNAHGGNKQWEQLAVGPVTGKVYVDEPASSLNKDQTIAKPVTAGYQDVHHTASDGGLWSAGARTRAGQNVDLLADPDHGNVVAKSRE